MSVHPITASDVNQVTALLPHLSSYELFNEVLDSVVCLVAFDDDNTLIGFCSFYLPSRDQFSLLSEHSPSVSSTRCITLHLSSTQSATCLTSILHHFFTSHPTITHVLTSSPLPSIPLEPLSSSLSFFTRNYVLFNDDLMLSPIYLELYDDLIASFSSSTSILPPSDDLVAMIEDSERDPVNNLCFCVFHNSEIVAFISACVFSDCLLSNLNNSELDVVLYRENSSSDTSQNTRFGLLKAFSLVSSEYSVMAGELIQEVFSKLPIDVLILDEFFTSDTNLISIPGHSLCDLVVLLPESRLQFIDRNAIIFDWLTVTNNEIESDCTGIHVFFSEKMRLVINECMPRVLKETRFIEQYFNICNKIGTAVEIEEFKCPQSLHSVIPCILNFIQIQTGSKLIFSKDSNHDPISNSQLLKYFQSIPPTHLSSDVFELNDSNNELLLSPIRFFSHHLSLDLPKLYPVSLCFIGLNSWTLSVIHSLIVDNSCSFQSITIIDSSIKTRASDCISMMTDPYSQFPKSLIFDLYELDRLTYNSIAVIPGSVVSINTVTRVINVEVFDTNDVMAVNFDCLILTPSLDESQTNSNVFQNLYDSGALGDSIDLCLEEPDDEQSFLIAIKETNETGVWPEISPLLTGFATVNLLLQKEFLQVQ
ncbi:hypothetical protein GEMRC1_005566 [Eukaryota sp. GEM-RC1]